MVFVWQTTDKETQRPRVYAPPDLPLLISSHFSLRFFVNLAAQGEVMCSLLRNLNTCRLKLSGFSGNWHSPGRRLAGPHTVWIIPEWWTLVNLERLERKECCWWTIVDQLESWARSGGPGAQLGFRPQQRHFGSKHCRTLWSLVNKVRRLSQQPRFSLNSINSSMVLPLILANVMISWDLKAPLGCSQQVGVHRESPTCC